MSEWVGGLIDSACQQAGILDASDTHEHERVGKKSLPPLAAHPSGTAEQPSYAAPPFWAESTAS